MTSELDWKIRKEFPPIRPEIQPPTEWGPLNVPPLDPDGSLQTVPSNVPPAESVTVHTHDGTGTNSTIVGGVEEEGSAVAVASGAQSVAVGDFAQATADNTVAIGSGTSATRSAIASATRAIAIGSGDATYDGATASAADAIAIGSSDATNACQATVVEGIAMGVGARATTGTGNISIGSQSIASGTLSCIAIGVQANAGVGLGVAIGNQAAVSTSAGVALGTGATANAGNDPIAIGHSTSCTGQGGVGLGKSVIVNATGAIGIGWLVNATGSGAIGIGSGPGSAAQATAADAISIGQNSVASAAQAISVGLGATSGGTSGTNSVAIGNGASAGNVATSVALGKSATVTKANQLMLGTATEVVTHPGGVEYRVNLKTNTDYTLTGQDYYVEFSTGNSNRVATLPPATTLNVGLTYWIKKIDAGTGTVTVTADATGTADTIDGAATQVIAGTQYHRIGLYVSAADLWSIISGPGAP